MAIDPNQNKKVRLNGQLVETSDEELRSLAQAKGLPAPPTTPGGAAAVGANPDVAKMAGTGQQKQAAVSVPLAGTQTLQGTQRLDQPRTQATGAETAQAAKAAQLKSLEGLDTRVQALVGQQLAAVQTQATATARFNQAQMDTLAPTVDKAGVEGLLTTYHQLNTQLTNPALTPEARAALQSQAFSAMSTLKNTHGIANPDDYLDRSTGQVGTAAAGALTDSVTMGSLDVAQLGVVPADMTSLLGPGWESLSVPEFSRKIEGVRQAEFQRINGLRAQLSSLAPGSAQREAVLRELGDAAQVGVTGVEQNVKQLAEKLNVADQVTFGGRTMPVADLLKDAKISQLVSDYLNESGDPAFKAKVKAENPAFAAWIEGNAASLSALSTEMGKTEAGLSDMQKAQKELATVGEGVSLNDEVMKALVPGWGETVSETTDLSDNALYTALTATTTSEADRNSIALKLNAEPKLAAALANLSPEAVVKAHQDAEAVASDEALKDLVGAEFGASGFLTDPAAQARLAKYAPLVKRLRGAGDEFQTMLEDPSFRDLLESDELNSKNIKAFIKNPNSAKEYFEYRDMVKEFAGIEQSGNINKALKFMFGDDGVSEKTLGSIFKEAKGRMALDPTDKQAATKYNALFNILGADGKLDKTEKKTLFAMIKEGLGGGTKTLTDAIKGKSAPVLDFNLRDKINSAVDPRVPMKGSTFADSMTAALVGDKQVTLEDMEDKKVFTDSQLKQLWAMPAAWQKTNKIPTKKQYDLYVWQKQETLDRVVVNKTVKTQAAVAELDLSNLDRLQNSATLVEAQKLQAIYDTIKDEPGSGPWKTKLEIIIQAFHERSKNAAKIQEARGKTPEAKKEVPKIKKFKF